jgi:hypothetical protein
MNFPGSRQAHLAIARGKGEQSTAVKTNGDIPWLGIFRIQSANRLRLFTPKISAGINLVPATGHGSLR